MSEYPAGNIRVTVNTRVHTAVIVLVDCLEPPDVVVRVWHQVYVNKTRTSSIACLPIK